MSGILRLFAVIWRTVLQCLAFKGMCDGSPVSGGTLVRRFLLFCTLLLAGWLGMPSPVFAAEQRLIAVVMANSQARYQEVHAVFAENSVFFCGSNCRIYVQTPNDDTMSLRNSVRKAIALGADLIVTYGPAATLAAQAESPRVPTLFADVYDPVGLGLVSAQKMTGRNMTGIRGDAPLQALFKYYTDATAPRKLAILYDQTSREGKLQKETLQESVVKKGIALQPLAVAGPDGYLDALRNLAEDTDGLFLASSEHTDTELAEVLGFAAKRRLPVITQRPGAAEMGAFMVLETSAREQGEKLAEIAGQVFAGAKTDQIPISRPRQVSFVINLKVAKDYGLQVPFETLSIASRIVR